MARSFEDFEGKINFSSSIINFQCTYLYISTLKVVQEYERAVIFRLGRLMQGGAKGPGKASSNFHFSALSNCLAKLTTVAT